ncbi:MAG: thiolase family protein, partial [Thermoanaerobaculia bacterium]
MEKCLIIDGVRSPIGIKKGEMIGIRADDLGAQVLKSLMERNKNIPKEEVEDIVLGCAFPEAVQGMLLGRAVALLAGFPVTTCGKVVNRFCGSSMDALHQIAWGIELGDLNCGIAIGVEDMISIPIGGFNPSFHPELLEIGYYMGMGETAENLARELNITREEQEEFSIESHKKALKAWAEGKFKNEVVPVKFNGKIIEKDEGPKEPDIEKIKSLEPAFLKD